MNDNDEKTSLYDYELSSKLTIWYFPLIICGLFGVVAFMVFISAFNLLFVQKLINQGLSTFVIGLVMTLGVVMGSSLIMRSPEVIVGEDYFFIQIPFLRYQSERIPWNKARILYPTQVQKLMGTERNIGFLVETELIHPLYEIVAMSMAADKCFFVSHTIKKYNELFEVFQKKLSPSS